MKNNKKGFTLIELLAVIVILAVLILLAMPAVLRLMESSRLNAFVIEVESMSKTAETAYAEQSILNGKKSTCMSVNDLVKEGYMNKNLKGYSGVIIVVPTESKTTIKAYISNGTYVVGITDVKDLTSDSVTDGTTAQYATCEAAKAAGAY